MSTIRTATTAVAAILLASAAQAEPSEFAGFYAGAHVGYADVNVDYSPGGEDDEGHGFGGLQAGYNFLTGNIIWGFETDVSLTGADPSGTCPFDATLSCEADIEGLTTLRARAGYASGDWLFYVTGGAAAINLDAKTSGAAGSSHDNEAELGWTAGAGVEHLLGGGLPGPRNVGVKLEYRYLSFKRDELDIDRTPTGITNIDLDVDSHLIMIGVNWHF